MEFIYGIYYDDKYSDDEMILLTPLHKTEESAKKHCEAFRKESKIKGEKFIIRKVALVY